MAAIAPVSVTMPERPLDSPPPSKPESSEDSSPAPAAAFSPAWVPPPMPAEPPWAKDPYMKEHRCNSLRPNPKAHRQQSMRVAKIALDYYNKKNKIKHELLEVGPVVSVASSSRPYKHINFSAISSKEGSREQLFFAELQLDVGPVGVWTTLRTPRWRGRMLTSLTALDVVRIYFIPKVQNMLAAIVPFHIFTTIQGYRQRHLRCYMYCLYRLYFATYVFLK